MVENLKTAIKYIGKSVLSLTAWLCTTFHAMLLRVKLSYVRRKLGANYSASVMKSDVVNRHKVMAVITHVVSKGKMADPLLKERALYRICNTIDNLCDSFSHCKLKIVINTIKNMHLIQDLPCYQRDRIEVKELSNLDPMYVGFKAQDEFIQYKKEYDWFLFLEDDIFLHDSCFLDKLVFFNRHTSNHRILLLPNRYELFRGNKTYIDLESELSGRYIFNASTILTIGEWQFAQFNNPHSGFYCLSGAQLEFWLKSPRSFYNNVVIVGPLESAATGCLLEVFTIYKPHISNLNYLEVQHAEPTYTSRRS